MLIDHIDFAELYCQQMRLAQRTEKTPEHWDLRAEKMATRSDEPENSYLQQLLAKIDLHGAQTLFDMGCGPGTVALALADKLREVYGVDYSPGMLAVAARRAQERAIKNVHWVKRAWEDPWDDLPQCDIAVASRSTLVADIRQAMVRLNRMARLRVYTTHMASSSFVPPSILRALGREVVELPDYIYALNVLYQMGIQARVDFIRGQCEYRQDTSTFEMFEENMRWHLGRLDDDERQRLYRWYQQYDASALVPARRDWALIYWDSVPEERLR
jgi:SAM-dependent methyltransferase